MRLLLYILLLFAFNTDAQITSSVYSGARYGGMVDTGDVQYIMLPGCSTQTEILGVDYLRNNYPVFDWRNTDFYTDNTGSPAGGSTACYSYLFSSSWMKNSAKYVSIFYDIDDDGEYEYLNTNDFLLTTDSLFGNYWSYYMNELTSSDELKYRMVFHDVPVYNSCPTSVNGLVYDGAVRVVEDCKPLICQDTINIKPCFEDEVAYICITDDTYVIPIVGSLGGISVTGLYQELSGSNVQVINDDGSYYIHGNYSSWSGWDIPELEDEWFIIEVWGYSEEWNSYDIIGYGEIDPISKSAFIEMLNINDYNDEWRIVIYSPQYGFLHICSPQDGGIRYPFTFLIIENPNIIIL